MPYFNPWEPELPGDQWTGWTEFELINDEDENMDSQAAPSVKRKAEGDHEEEPATHNRTLEHEGDENMGDASELSNGLNMLGFDPDVVEWLLSKETEITAQLNECGEW